MDVSTSFTHLKMPHFCIFDHPKMPIIRVSIEPRRRDETKDGFRLRYIVQVASADHADDVISTLDDLMGKQTRAHGIYQASYDAVKAEYDGLLRDAMSDAPLDWSPLLRAAAVVAGVVLTIGMSIILPCAVLLWLFVSALKSQSGLTAMAESAVVWSIFDWRPFIQRLFHYANTGIWLK